VGLAVEAAWDDALVVVLAALVVVLVAVVDGAEITAGVVTFVAVPIEFPISP
jgi:hypothetical protein